MADDKCPSCGAVLEIGSFPFCPHGDTRAAIVRDEIPGGQVFENGFDTPQTFFSHSEHRKALEARGLTVAAKWAGPTDKVLSRMDIPCAQTLANARILLTRGTRMPEAEPLYPITVTDVHYPKVSPIVEHLDRFYPKDTTP